MVQRKVTNKLGIIADYGYKVKTNDLFVNLKKPSSFQNHDAINRGPDLKKKMKKSRPTKAALPTERQIPMPGKPPPLPVPKPASSPQKKALPRSSEGTPNYMKSTSSSDARKEVVQVSSRNLQTLFDNKISSSRAKVSLNSARILARTSSLKLVRTLTKTTSFKPARASSVKRCSTQRATCSSTLKDSKFPAYLQLSSGGTESQGTSVMKVCPYTYCSLNGHHHPPLPPLRCFLSARRRMIKAQRVMKPTAGDLAKGGRQVEKMMFDELYPNQQGLNGCSGLEEKQRDFFIQIYSKQRQGIEDITEFFSHVGPLDNQHSLELVTDESLSFDVGSGEDSIENSYVFSSSMEDSEVNKEVNQKTQGGEEDYSVSLTQQKPSIESLSFSHGEIEGTEILPIDNTKLELSDMDWEIDSCSVSLESSQDSDLQEPSIRFGSCITPSKIDLKEDAIVMIKFLEEIQADGLLESSAFDEESVSSAAYSYRDFEIHDYIQGTDNKAQLPGSIGEKDVPVEEHSQTQEPCSAETNVPRDYLEVYDAAAEEIWDLESQDFHDSTEGSSKEGWKDPADRKDEGKEEADICNTPIREELFTSLLDASEATKNSSRGQNDNHLQLSDLDARSDETLSGQEKRPLSMSTYGIVGSKTDDDGKLKWKYGSKRFWDEYEEEPKEFNPRGPNFLPREPDPEAEKVDLKHQNIDERKNSDEWMLDHAIQEAVTKLGQARKKKVALLVEAFETVMPIQRFKTQQRHASVALIHAPTIQACS